MKKPGAINVRCKREGFRPVLDVMESRQLLSVASETIVTGLYREVLLRDPDPQGLARFTRILDSGSTIREVANRLYSSAEFRQDEVTYEYEQILDREPTSEELSTWLRALNRGVPESRVAAAIAGSNESVSRFAGDTQGYARSLYVGLLGHQPDAKDLSQRTDQLNSGVSPQAIAGQLTASNEYRISKVQVAYQALLNRLPTAGEGEAWASRGFRSGGLKGFSLRILTSRENVSRLRGGQIAAPDLTAMNELRQILLAPYTEGSDGFVKLYNRLLGTNPSQDSKGNPIASPPTNLSLWNLMKAGASDGRPGDEVQTITRMTLPVGSLIPLQNEIDLDKSLGYVLGKDPASSDLEQYLAGGVITPFGGSILTGGGGKYIVDGHHRWSSIFVINPDAQIAAVDVGYQVKPQDYLKITQMAVGAEMGYLQVQSVDGQNLFTISRSDFDSWVASTIQNGENPQAVLAVFQRTRGLSGIPAIADFLWGNVERMRQNNQPATGATSRDFMPQPPSSGVDALLAWLESGNLNDRLPTVARLG